MSSSAETAFTEAVDTILSDWLRTPVIRWTPPAGAGGRFRGSDRMWAQSCYCICAARLPVVGRQGEGVTLAGCVGALNQILGALTAPHSLYSQIDAPEWKQAALGVSPR
ncbi:hypothetical protein MKANGN_57140 [Mycobacterium kansasii]|nr:hypothetical protein MKANGN_57140 [Mycobacterium kansasii]